MTPLTHYSEFVDTVERLGFLPLSHGFLGLPSLSSLTLPEAWHTGDVDTDPWQWKDRAAAEQRLAYGRILNGHKGFVSPHFYAAFFAAFRPEQWLAERYEMGLLNQTVWQVWQIVEDSEPLDTAQIRRLMGVTGKQGGSRVDAALETLQREFFLTVAGSRRKISKSGQPYGWPAEIYAKVEAWAPAAWRQTAGDLSLSAARALILSAPVVAEADSAQAAGALGFV